MYAKQTGVLKSEKEKRDPQESFVTSMYQMGVENGQPYYGFPATGVKNALVSIAHKDKGLAKTDVQKSLWIKSKLVRAETAHAGSICGMPLIRIIAPPLAVREEMVRAGAGLNKTSTLAYRGHFWPWAMQLEVHGTLA
jgi:hypothetical protein